MFDAAASPLHPLWRDDDGLGFLDQRALPEIVVARAADADAAMAAIASGALAGRGCIEIAAAFALAFVRRDARDDDPTESLRRVTDANATTPAGATMLERILAAPPEDAMAAAEAILDERRRIDRAIATQVSALVPSGAAILAHGGVGALSSGGEATALGGIIGAWRAGRALQLFLTDSGLTSTGRLNAFECTRSGMPWTLIPDRAAAALMRSRPLAAVLVAAEAIAVNGDCVAELGTYALALGAAYHRIPVFVSAPRAAIDRNARDAAALGASSSIVEAWSTSTDDRASNGVAVPMPVPLDVTPGNLIAGIITEFGRSRPPYDESLDSLSMRPNFAFIAAQ